MKKEKPETGYPIAGHQHDTTGRRELNSFTDMLNTWDGDVVEVTLTTGATIAGQLQLSHDGVTAWFIGQWVGNSVNNDRRQADPDRERAVLVSHIIGVEYLKEIS
jgi:hypothetical protein